IVQRGAIFSPCRRYRYALWRVWDVARPLALFVCLNPSTADGQMDDPTVRRCVGFARTWGYGGVSVANLFAFRAIHPADLKVSPDPVGPDNDAWLTALAGRADIVVAAWGNHGTFMNRSRTVFALISNPQCLALTRQGQPAHPLYLKKTLIPAPLSSPFSPLPTPHPPRLRQSLSLAIIAALEVFQP
ncbi:MAG: DUF1643 domain-containing protein, partial [Ardenticatenaceae bacterium]